MIIKERLVHLQSFWSKQLFAGRKTMKTGLHAEKTGPSGRPGI